MISIDKLRHMVGLAKCDKSVMGEAIEKVAKDSVEFEGSAKSEIQRLKEITEYVNGADLHTSIKPGMPKHHYKSALNQYKKVVASVARKVKSMPEGREKRQINRALKSAKKDLASTVKYSKEYK